jgi:hypothetical protein
MKNILLTSLCVLLVSVVFGQNAPGEVVSTNIAVRLKDSLMLSDSQKIKIYEGNMLLNSRKQAVRQNFSSLDTIRRNIQKIEFSRDSLYQTILSVEQYQMYLDKKANLLRN